MPEFIRHLLTWYRLRLLPTIKRMLSPRRRVYTGLVIGTLTVSAVILTLLCGYYATAWANARTMQSDFEMLVASAQTVGIPSPTLADLRSNLLLARADVIASMLFALGLWILLSTLAIRWVMKYVLDAESETYALYMIFGSDHRQLRRQIGTEFLLSGAFALICGVPIGYAICSRLTGKPLPSRSVWLALFCFALLVGAISVSLSRRLLGQPLLHLLNAADTSSYVTSPRRSATRRPDGRQFTPFHNAAISFWRMRTYFLSMALAVGILAAFICNVLTPSLIDGQAVQTEYTVSFANGISYEQLEELYLDPFLGAAGVHSVLYEVGNTADELNTHVLLDSSQIQKDRYAVYTGDQCATNAIRIACGDGEVGTEMGGGMMVPGIWNDQYVPPYSIRPVASGCAILVRPADTDGELALEIGDTVRLYATDGTFSADERPESADEVAVRITDVIEVPAFYSTDYPPQYIRPRITEECLLLSPLDYGDLTGKQHAVSIQAQEAYPSDVFQNDRSCVLVLPNGYTFEQDLPSAVTVITSAETLKRPFYDALDKENNPTLPTDTFYIDTSLSVTGFYLGTLGQYAVDTAAVRYMAELPSLAYQSGLVGAVCDSLCTTEYRIERIVYHDGSTMPYVLLPKQETAGYTQLCTEVSALGLFPTTNESPALFQAAQEAYLLQTDQTLQHPHLLLGTSLLPEFVSYANSHSFHLFFTPDDYAVTATTVCGNFSINGRRFALAYPNPNLPYICSDDYPLLITGTGSCIVSEQDIATLTTQNASDCGVYGIFHAEDIGSLREQSRPLEGMYARNDWYIRPDCETSFGDLTEELAIYVTAGDTRTCSIQAGDTIRVAVRLDPSLVTNRLEYADLDSMQKLLFQLEFPTDYMDVTIREVVSGSEDTLVLSEEDFSRMANTTAIYERISISVYPMADVEDHLTLHKLVQDATDQAENASLTYHNRAVYAAATGKDKQGDLWRWISLPALLIIPLILCTAQRAFYDKRREEYEILHALGRARRTLAATALVEGVLLSLATAACAVALYLPIHLLVIWWAQIVGMPMTYAPPELRLFGVILAVVTVSCILPTMVHAQRIITSPAASARRKKGRHTKT